MKTEKKAVSLDLVFIFGTSPFKKKYNKKGTTRGEKIFALSAALKLKFKIW